MAFAHFVRMAFTWYKDQSTAESCNFGALAVIWPLLERMGVIEIINRHLPADPQAEFDHGRVLSLLAAARLYRPVPLVNLAQWASESGADILWNIPVEKITDDRAAKSLDALFTQRHSILASLALHASHEFGVLLSEVHYDPTHILLHGAYEVGLRRSLLADDQLDALFPLAASVSPSSSQQSLGEGKTDDDRDDPACLLQLHAAIIPTAGQRRFRSHRRDQRSQRDNA